MPTGPKVFFKVRVGCSPAPGPTLKRRCAILIRLVGRKINTVDQTYMTQPRVIPLAQWADSRYPTGLCFLLTNHCLTRFPCILFLLLEYICFSINLFVFPGSFFCQHHNSSLALSWRSTKFLPLASAGRFLRKLTWTQCSCCEYTSLLSVLLWYKNSKLSHHIHSNTFLP